MRRGMIANMNKAWDNSPFLPLLAKLAFWRQYWMIGERELAKLPEIARRKGLAIDVGGNVGNYTYALQRLGHRVVTFEPDDVSARRLRALIGAQLDLRAVALSDRAGVANMRVPVLGTGVHAGGLASLSQAAVPDEHVDYQYSVELRTLDSFDFHGVSFIKIDVEGHEEEVLRGSLETIARERPALMIEIEERHNQGGLARVQEMLKPLGYRALFLDGDRWADIAEFKMEVHQKPPENINALTNFRNLGYVNNFVFQPS